MKFLPAEGHISVIVEKEYVSPSGIVLTDNAFLDRLSKGKVVGTSQTRVETTNHYLDPKYEVDDTVVFLKGNGLPIKLDGFDILILAENEVLGKILD